MARFPGRDEALAEASVTQQDLDYATQQVRLGRFLPWIW